MNKRKKITKNKERGMFIIILLFVGFIAFAMSDFSPFATYDVADNDATVDLDYGLIQAGNNIVWSLTEDIKDYWHTSTTDSVNFDADLVSPLSIPDEPDRTTTFNPEVGTNFGLLGYINEYGDVKETIVSTNEVEVSGYIHTYYTLRFRMFITAFSGIQALTTNVDYTTENGKTVTVDEVPETKIQSLIFTMFASAALGNSFPDDSALLIESVGLASNADDGTRVIFKPTTGETLYYVAETSANPIDSTKICAYNNIQFGDIQNGEFTIAIPKIAAGAVYEDGQWFGRDARLYFDFDMNFDLVTNIYTDARWGGSVIDGIAAFIPQSYSELLPQLSNPITLLMIVGVLLASIGGAYALMRRNVVKYRTEHSTIDW